LCGAALRQLHSFLDEMSELSRKKPNDPVNKFKLKFINTVVNELNKLIQDYRPFKDFEQFDVDALPSNSVVVLILAQYAGAVQLFRTEQSTWSKQDHIWYWIVKGKTSGIPAGNPEDFKYKPK
jgi:hypothetical protein